MSYWKQRATIKADVVFFSYRNGAMEKQAEEVYIWDLDKTYLDTTFETMKGLIRTAFEKGHQKKNIPGTAALVRALKEVWQKKHNSPYLPFYFITGSPPQMEPKIKEKLQLDGLEPTGIFFKDNMQNLKPKRLWRLTKQVGFKLQSLMQVRQRLNEDVRQIMWGDDSESDAVIYSLYSDICARRLNETEIRKALKFYHVVGSQVDTILELQSQLPLHDPVEKVYINLAVDTDAEYYLKFGRRVIPTYNSFQSALDLFQDQRIEAPQVVQVAQDLMTNYEFTTDELEKSLDDLIRRQVLGEPALNEILPTLVESQMISSAFKPTLTAKAVANQIEGRVYELEGNFEPWVPERIDYFHDYR